jgi:DNA-binding NtrC family response regulator
MEGGRRPARRAAPGRGPVLIAGEVGVGKLPLLVAALEEAGPDAVIEVIDCA